MLLTSDQEMIRDAVRDFAQRELWPHAARWDKEHHFPKDAHRGLAARLWEHSAHVAALCCVLARRPGRVKALVPGDIPRRPPTCWILLPEVPRALWEPLLPMSKQKAFVLFQCERCFR